MRDLGKLLLAALIGAGIALGGVALGSDADGATQPINTELRVIAEGRFEAAVQDIHETYSKLLEQKYGIRVPFIEGPEPCAGIGDDRLRDICIDGLGIDPP